MKIRKTIILGPIDSGSTKKKWIKSLDKDKMYSFPE